MRKSFTRFLSLFMLFSIISLFAVAVPAFTPTISPGSPATNVDPRSGSVTVTLTFAENAYPGTSGAGVIALSNSSDVQLDPIQISGTTNTNPVTGSTVVINGKVVTITFQLPSKPEQTTFYVTATSDALQNAAGVYWAGLNSIPPAYPGGTHGYVFTTGDFTSPKVLALTPFNPVDNSSANAIGKIYTVTFDENIQPGTGLIQTGDAVSKPGNIGLYKENGDVVELYDVKTATATTTPVEGAVGIVGSTLYINPTDANLKELGKYYVRILPTAITDFNTTPFVVDNKNKYAGINDNTTWNFQLADLTPPTFAVSPANASTLIQQTQVMKMTFADNRTAAGLTFALQKVTGLAPTTVAALAVGDNVTSLVSLMEDVTGGTTWAAASSPWKATYTATNEITIEFTTAAKFVTGANYKIDVIANSFADIEKNIVVSAPSTFKAGDFTAPTASATFLQQGGYGSNPLPWIANSTAGDKETTKLFFGVTTVDNVVPVSGLGTLPGTVKYVVNTSATLLTPAVILATGTDLPIIASNNDKHQAVITTDAAGATLASNTLYFIHYVATDNATVKNTSVEYVNSITTNDIVAPTYTVVFKDLANVVQTSTGVDKQSKIVVTFNENVAINSAGTLFSATPSDFATTLTLKQTNVTPNVTLVSGVNYTVTKVSDKVFEIYATHSNWASASWMSKGNYSLAIDGSKIFDLAGSNPPYGTANAAASSTNLFTVKDYEGPTVVFSPANAATNADNNGNVTITFSEAPYYLGSPVTQANVDALIELRKGDATTATTGSPLEPRTITLNGNVVTITPTNKPLSSEIKYRASVSTDITDENGFKLNKNSDNSTAITVPASLEYSVFGTADNRTPLVTYTTYNGVTVIPAVQDNVARVAQGLVNVDNIAYPVILLDESVQEIAGNTPIASLDANQIRTLITFKKGDANGPNVEFNVLLASTNTGLIPPPTGMFEIVLDPINYPGAYTYDNSGTYYFSIGGIQDAAKNAINGSATFSVINSTALTLTGSAPANAATGVAKSGNLVLTFNQNISKTTTSGSLITSAPAGLSIDVTNVGVTVSGNQVTIPYSGFTANTGYTITVPAGVFNAVANNAPNGVITRTFTTVDEYGPTIDLGTAASPDESAPNTVALSNGQLSLTFTENIVLGNGYIKIRKPELAGATTVADINVQSSYVTIDPLNAMKAKITIPVTLLYNQPYFVEIPQSAFKDAAGNNFQWSDSDHAIALHTADVTAPLFPYSFGDATWDFSTVTDATPTLVSFIPAAGSNDVAPTAGLTINFSEPVALASSGIRELTVFRAADNTTLQTINLATASLSWNATMTQVTVSHLDFEANKAYYVNLSPNAFKDATGNNVAGLTSTSGTGWYFTTQDLTAPTAVLTTASGAALTAVPLADNLVLTFSEPVALVLPNTWGTALTLSTGAFTATLDASNKILTINPGTDFSSLTSATLSINAGTIKDLASVPNVIGGSVIALKGEDKTAPVMANTVLTPYAKDKVTFTAAIDEVSTVYYLTTLGGSLSALPSVASVKGSAQYSYNASPFVPNAVKNIEITGLAEYTTYDVYVLAEDLFGNQTAVTKWVLKTTDATAPTLSLLTPLNNAIDVNYNHGTPAFNGVDLKIKFSETVAFTGLNAKLVVRNYVTNVKVWEADETAATPTKGQLALANSSLTTTNDVVWVNVPKAVLADKTMYYVEFEYNMVTDVKNGLIGAANLKFGDAFIGKADWSFTTADETVPVLAATAPATTTVPAFGAVDVPVSAPGTLTMRFSEPIAIGTGTIYIYRVGNATPQEVITLPNIDVVVNPANNKELLITRHNIFASEVSYYVQFPATGVKDLAPVPNYFAGIPPSTWVFSTADITSPSVSWNVANNATSVPTATVVTAQFLDPRQTELVGTTYEPIFNSGTAVANASDIKGWFTVTANGSPAALTSAVYTTAPPATVTFTVTGGLLSNTTYVFTLNAPATLTDDKGNLVPSSSVTFSTVDNSSPTITFTPATTATNVAVDAYVTVKFNKTIYNNNMLSPGTSPNANFTPTAADFASGNYVTFKQGIINVPFTTEVVTPGVEYRLKPTSALASSTVYDVVWIAQRGSAQEVYDRLALPTENKLDQLLAARTTSFTTTDVVAPTVVSLNPLNNPAGIVNPTAALTITFTEKVKAGTGNIQIRRGNGQIFAEVSPSDVTYSAIAPWTATIPHPAFEKYTTYYVIIPNGAITDVSPNANKFAGFADNTKWSFKTDDGTAPYITLYSPANGSVNIPVFSNLTLQMSENIQANAGNIVIYYKNFVDPVTGDGNAVEIIPIGSTKVVISGSNVPQGLTSDVITIDPSTTFDKLGTFYIRIDNGTVKDFAATPNNYAGISNNTTWAFTVTDNTKPALSSTSPVNNAIGIGSLPTLTMNFDRNVMAGSGAVKILEYYYNPSTFAYEEKLVESIPVTSSQVVINGMVVTVTPSVSLGDNKVFYVLVDNTAITNTASSKDPWAGISSPFIWRFTTADNTAPTVAASPASGNAMLNTFAVTLTFNETVTGVDANSVTVTGGTVVVAGSGAVYTATVTAADYANVVLSLSSAIKDGTGNALVATSYTYKVGDNNGPTLVATPGAGVLTKNVFDVKLDFNKDVTGVATAVTVDNGATVNVTGSGKAYIATVKAKVNSTVNLTVSTAVKDTALHSFTGATFAYTTGDNTPPVLAITGPTGQIPTTFILTFTFDENVTGFKDALTAVNGTIKQVAGSGKEYLVSINAAEKAAVKVTVANTVKDVAGNAFAGKSATFNVGDFTSPTVEVTPPASPVATVFTVDLKFDEAVSGVADGVTVTGGKLDKVAATVVDGKPDVTATLYTLTVSAKEQTTVTLVLTGAITDISPNTNAFAGKTLTYTTGDFTHPTVVTLSPTDGETTADNHPTFKMTFSENVALGAGGTLKVYRINSKDAVLTIPITAGMINGKDVTITYAATQKGLDRNTRYYVLVDNTALTDVAGNTFDGVKDVVSWIFKTGANWVTNLSPENSLEFKVYPNPFVEFVNIDNASKLSKVIITNIAGQTVKEVVNPTDRIQLNELRSGIYFISLYNMDNVISQTAKIVKR